MLSALMNIKALHCALIGLFQYM